MRFAYWDYYKTIEDDLITASRYVEFCTHNYSCYSVEFARIIMAAGSELDMIFKVLCKKINPATNADNINEYFFEVTSRFPNIINVQRYVRGYQLLIKPFENWQTGIPPKWWTDGFNKIKHQRNTYFHYANLENTLNIVAGLIIVLFHFYSLEYGNPLYLGINEQNRLIVQYMPSDPDTELMTSKVDMLA